MGIKSVHKMFFLFFLFFAGIDQCIADEPDFYLGVNTHFYKATEPLEPSLGKIKSAHLNSIRGSITWQNVESVKGSFGPTKANDFRQIAAIDESVKKGLHPLLILDFGNPLYEPDGLVTTPAAREGFANYVKWLATRYKGKVHLYEVWNEWATGMGSVAHPWKPGTVEQYAELIKVASKAVKSVDPTAKVIAASIGNYSTPWFKSLLETGAGKYLDGFSVHPYNYSYLRVPGRNTPEASWEWVDQLHALASNALGKEVDFYVTEIGWPSYGGDAGYTEDAAAENLIRFVTEGRSRNYVKGIWWYDMIDDGSDANNKEHHFGLLLPDMREKATYKAIRKMGGLLESSDKVSVGRNSGSATARFERAGRTIACVRWTDHALMPVKSIARTASSIQFSGADCQNVSKFSGTALTN